MEYIDLIKVELQTKIFKQHKDRITPRIDPRDSDMTGSQFREEQHDGAKQIEQTLVPLKTCSQGQPGNGYNKISSESFEQSSKKDALLVTPKIKKLTKDDKKQGLKCSISGCYFTTSATIKKAKKQIKQHEEKHRKEEKALIEATIVTNDETKIFEHHKVKTTIAETTNAINNQVEHTLITNTGSDNGLMVLLVW